MSDQGISYKPFFHNALRRIFTDSCRTLPRPAHCKSLSTCFFLRIRLLSRRSLPEHVRLSGDQVVIRPIAGTRHRGKTEAEDVELKDLLSDAKERAEHLMLVDLARNDIGRVCEYRRGSRLHDHRALFHVMHIVSQVTGTICPESTAYDLMRATLPAGTLSGAPSATPQIISELEQCQRGIYGGALGYFGEGNHDSCIGIRTAVLKDGKIFIQSGAGVWGADSVPESELMETVNKAKGMLKAVALAEKIFEMVQFECKLVGKPAIRWDLG